MSMQGAIDNIESSFNNLVAELQSSIPNLAFGVAAFQDFPLSPFGAETDLPYQLILPVTTNFNSVLNAIAILNVSGGGDLPESGNEALYQLATGKGITNQYVTVPPTNSGFRNESIRIVVLVTNSTFHEATDYTFSGAHSKIQALDILQQTGIASILINVGANATVRNFLIPYAIETKALVRPVNGFCHTGINGSTTLPVNGECPLVYDCDASGTGISSQITSAILEFLNQ